MSNISKKLKCLWRSMTVCVISVIALAGCATNKNSLPIISLVGNNKGRGFTAKHYQNIVQPEATTAVHYSAQVNASPKESIRRYKNIPIGQMLLVGNVTSKPSELLLDSFNLANNNVVTDLLPIAHAQFKEFSFDDHQKNSFSEAASKTILVQGKILPSAIINITTEPVAVIAAGHSNSSIVGWRWPTYGKIIDKFSSDERGNRGVDISGARGQPILSTASGRVVYAGNDLRGYGNLIIIKHNNHYLSAYAHNDKLLVQEQQEVKAGQKISTMGSTGTTTTKLHFAIHYQGKAVNPLRYLPKS